ncbi:MAG TPA: POTRA domain-containing protein [Blastocatellia bacterium]|nr:POTRA domain-containing protein [Blastocatellia bacterium]
MTRIVETSWLPFGTQLRLDAEMELSFACCEGISNLALSERPMKHGLDSPARSDMSPKNFSLNLAIFVLVSSIHLSSVVKAQQASPSEVFRITKIEVAGLKRYSRDDVITASGLRPGGTMKTGDLDQAVKYMLATGMFKRAAYRYSSLGNNISITLEIEEEDWSVPIVFDNFVWFSDQDIASEIRRKFSSYDGRAPASGPVLDTIRDVLQKMLEERGLHGTVDYLGQSDLYGQNRINLFSVKGIDLPVCDVQFPGASKDMEPVLLAACKSVIGSSYSRSFLDGFAAGTLLAAYQSRGYLTAVFQKDQTSLDLPGQCKKGVLVVLPVVEGEVYHFGGIEFTGNRSLSSEKLSAAVGLRTGDVADAGKVANGLWSIKRSYDKIGYIEATSISKCELAGSNRLAFYEITINEGPRYRMGTFTVVGFPEEVAERLRQSWRLRPGEVYDDSYGDDFLTQPSTAAVVRRAMRDTKEKANLNLRTVLDKESLTVNVVLSLQDSKQ